MKHDVFLIAPVRHTINGVEADSPRIAALAAVMSSEDEIQELHDNCATPAWMNIERMHSPAGSMMIEVRDDQGEVTHWQADHGGAVKPVDPKKLAGAQAVGFVTDFLALYDAAKIFAWEDDTMKRLRERAIAILSGPKLAKAGG